MKKTAFLLTIIFATFSSLQAQDNEMLTKTFASLEVNMGQSHSLYKTAMSIFPDEILQDNYSVDCNFTAALNTGSGYAGLKFVNNSFTTTSIYKEDVYVYFLALTMKEFRTIYNNLEAFYGISIGAIFINNEYKIADVSGKSNRHGLGIDLSIGLDYSYKKYYVGVYGTFSEQTLGSKPDVKLSVETTKDYFVNFATNIGLCFGIRL